MFLSIAPVHALVNSLIPFSDAHLIYVGTPMIYFTLPLLAIMLVIIALVLLFRFIITRFLLFLLVACARAQGQILCFAAL